MNQFDQFGNIVTIDAAATPAVVVAAPEAKKTLTRAEKFAKRIQVLTERIAKDTVELAQVTLESTTTGRLEGVEVGTKIIARLGRAGSAAIAAVAAVLAEDGVTVVTPAVAGREATAGTLKNVAAEVLGVKELDDGSLRFKVGFGEGFDADTAVIQATQIVEVLVAEVPAE